jgi:U3 small nucleolar RNA-associated protein 11
MKSRLHGISENNENKHVIFVENEEEVEEFDPVEYFDTIPEALDRTYNRPKVSALKTDSLIVNSVDNDTLKQVLRERNKEYREMLAREERMKKLKTAAGLIQNEKNLMVKKKTRKKSTESNVWEKKKI